MSYNIDCIFPTAKWGKFGYETGTMVQVQRGIALFKGGSSHGYKNKICKVDVKHMLIKSGPRPLSASEVSQQNNYRRITMGYLFEQIIRKGLSHIPKRLPHFACIGVPVGISITWLL
jgi:hypothetical protein